MGGSVKGGALVANSKVKKLFNENEMSIKENTAKI